MEVRGYQLQHGTRPEGYLIMAGSANTEHKPWKKAYILRGKYGGIIGVFPDKETLEANIPYGSPREFEERIGRQLEPSYRIEEVPLFLDNKRNPLIQQLIACCKFGVDTGKVFF